MTNHAVREDSVQMTMRVGRKQKEAWKERARKSGMSLTMYVCYVMDRTDIVVSTSALPRETDEVESEGHPRTISRSSRRTTPKSTSVRRGRTKYSRATAK